jgi:hypothetical protein
MHVFSFYVSSWTNLLSLQGETVMDVFMLTSFDSLCSMVGHSVNLIAKNRTHAWQTVQI